MIDPYKLALLQESWKTIEGPYGIKPDTFRYLLDLYSDPRRKYHTTDHLYSCISQAIDSGLNMYSQRHIIAAIWFHDAIYTCSHRYDEDESCRLFTYVSGNSPKSLIINMIQATKNHFELKSPNDDLAVFLNIDLSILHTQYDEYHKYARDILAEYSAFHPAFSVTKESVQPRVQFLKSILKNKSIYYNNIYQSIRDVRLNEKQARENIDKEICLLESM